MSQPHWNSNQFSIPHTLAVQLTNHELRAAPAAGLRLYVTDIHLYMGDTAQLTQLLDGSGGTVLWASKPTAATSVTANFKVPIPLTAATALCCTTAGTTANGFLVVNGFIARA